VDPVPDGFGEFLAQIRMLIALWTTKNGGQPYFLPVQVPNTQSPLYEASHGPFDSKNIDGILLEYQPCSNFRPIGILCIMEDRVTEIPDCFTRCKIKIKITEVGQHQNTNRNKMNMSNSNAS
jgi:hypothetical protein